MYKVNKVQSQTGKSDSGFRILLEDQPQPLPSVSVASTDSLKRLDAHVEQQRGSPTGSPSTERAFHVYVQHFKE